ncbi:uncharacterized protein ARB_05113 [Trichophyton benhamiae CBS 112371]|uniref:Suppressor protein SRP40 n=1 Tax=Arthroderma benhamiae (strain ATCC MYA-4681 / CBS 112371) TaxID=663331 RepID=D4ALB6_ARTBC|nr:uncharacterized protein ARB_05113 [Trichophyton benhamiae CBS 112371]EFE36175.1 conserved hypothetical protein [Trichophyton benhamiae CBS 112371]
MRCSQRDTGCHANEEAYQEAKKVSGTVRISRERLVSISLKVSSLLFQLLVLLGDGRRVSVSLARLALGSGRRSNADGQCLALCRLLDGGGCRAAVQCEELRLVDALADTPRRAEETRSSVLRRTRRLREGRKETAGGREIRPGRMSDAVKRLHITPLDAAILETVLQPSIRPLATDISLHTIETHPENNYGFVSLPKAEAEKLTRKLNGAFLKGRKLKIEAARPAPSSQLHAEPEVRAPSTGPEKGVALKRRAIDHVIEGYELPASRKVMRGWTEPRSSSGRSKKKDEDSKKAKKSKQPSKYSSGSECLFRTVPPASKSAKTKSGSSKQKKKKKGGAESVTVHEFKQTVKHPSFVKTGENVPPSKLTGEYVEGKGWVDREGNVKEEPPKKSERPAHTTSVVSKQIPKSDAKKGGESPVASDECESSAAESSSSEDYTSSEGSDSSSESESDEKEEEEEEEDGSDTSSTGTSSSEESETEKPEAVEQETPAPTVEENKDTPKVHPLEALFKRPKPSNISIPNPQLTIDTQFSFFGNAEDSGSEDEARDKLYTEPQTPFTAQDLQSRSMRSLAPTPDTALPTKITFWGEDSNVNDLHDDDDRLDTPSAERELPSSPTKPGAKRGKEAAEDSEFAQWFWENRGDNNRAWKRRRREAGKERRQRENRSHSSRGRK